mmetsp:Transcript_136933/g.292500  ORF Transcript_136933/g.292500 Transcript_136933/m.292500 type:complete len:342 (-) Transcript_136933:67-1092(-)
MEVQRPVVGGLTRHVSEPSFKRPARGSTIDIGNLRSTLGVGKLESNNQKRHSFLRRNGENSVVGSTSRRPSKQFDFTKRSSTIGNVITVEDEQGAENLEEAMAQLPKEPSITDRAPVLAWTYKLELYETQVILTQWAKMKRNAAGGVDFADFYKFVCAIFDLTSINEEVAQTVFDSIRISKDADIERFLHWYMTNLFSVITMFTASPEKAASEKLVAQVAKDHGVGSSEIDNIKRAFDKYDKDGSGLIDKSEFTSMIHDMLKVKDPSHMPPQRIDKFWQEIDADGSGEVDFSEFAEWYLKYFDPEASSANQKASCKLAEAFYDGFSPEILRHRHLGAMSSA